MSSYDCPCAHQAAVQIEEHKGLPQEELHSKLISVRAEVARLDGVNCRLQEQVEANRSSWEQEVLCVRTECEEVTGNTVEHSRCDKDRL